MRTKKKDEVHYLKKEVLNFVRKMTSNREIQNDVITQPSASSSVNRLENIHRHQSIERTKPLIHKIAKTAKEHLFHLD